LIGNKIIVS